MKLRYTFFSVVLAVQFGIAESAPAPAYNEFSGTVVSVDPEARLLRMALDGGYNVQFTFDSKSVVINGHDPIKISDLNYGDKVTARYSGRDLYAQEIVRTGKGAASAAAPETPALTEGENPHSVVSSATTSTPTPTP